MAHRAGVDAIASALREIGWLLRLRGEPRYKVQAYERAAAVVEEHAERIPELVEDGRLQELTGIGSSIERTVAELHLTGRSSLQRKLRDGFPRDVVRMARLPGLGGTRLRTLQRELDVQTLDDLESACTQGRVRTVKGMGPTLERSLLSALKHAKEEDGQVLRSEAMAWCRPLIDRLEGVVGVETVVWTGPVRRGVPLVEAVDLLVAGGRAEDVRAALPPSATGGPPWSLRLPEGIKARVHHAEPRSFGLEWVRTTADDGHWRMLEARASQSGAAWPPSGGATEGDVYRAIGLQTIPPELREAGAPAWDGQALVTLRDIRGAIHTHTVDSDGRNTVLEMADGAEALGLDYIAITDHSPSATYAHGVEIERLRAQQSAIEEAQRASRVRILKGTESDIHADGRLDHPPDVLKELDVVIASLHSRFRQPADRMTARIRTAVSGPTVVGWGHPRAGILLRRRPVECDLPACLEALRDASGWVELNGDPHRLDLDREGLRLAVDIGVPIVIAPDAHSVARLADLEHGVTAARRAGLTPDHVLNTGPVGDFVEAVRPASRS